MTNRIPDSSSQYPHDPIKKTSSECLQTKNESATAKLKTENSEEKIKLNTLLENQFERSRTQRMNKVEHFTTEEKTELGKLTRALEEVLEKTKRIQELSNDEDVDLHSSEIKKLKNEIAMNQFDILNTFVPFLLSPKSISIDLNPLETMLFYESTLNAFVNRTSYIREVKTNLQANFGEILDFFNLPSTTEISNITIPDSETHNQGKSVAFITLKHEEQNDFQLVYKPRNAKIDAAIIKVFHEINNLSKSDKSAKYDLPLYNIFHCNSGNASVWEFVAKDSLRPSYTKNPESLGGYVWGKSKSLQIKASRLDDVPYLSAKAGILYYGTPENNIVLGTKEI